MKKKAPSKKGGRSKETRFSSGRNLPLLGPAEVPEGRLNVVHVLVDQLRVGQVARRALIEDVTDAERDRAAPPTLVGNLRVEEDLVADAGDAEVVAVVADVRDEQGGR